MSRKLRSNAHRALFAAAVLAAVPHSVHADKNWSTGVSSGNWNVGGNWAENAVPNNSENITIGFNDAVATHTVTYNGALASSRAIDIHNSGTGNATLQIATGFSLTIRFVNVASAGQGQITQTGGAFFANTSLDLAGGTGSGAVYAMSGGTFTISAVAVGGDSVKVGDVGSGTFNQSAGLTNIASPLYLGFASGSTGNYNLSGSGTLSATADEFIGYNGSGTFNQTGGTNAVAANVNIGFNTATSVYNLNGASALASITGTLYLGGNNLGPLGNGVVNLQNGTMSITNTLKIGNTGATVFNLSGGLLKVGTLDTSFSPTRFNWTNGNLALTNGGLFLDASGPLGSSLALSSTKNLSVSGTLQLSTSGTLNQNGGILTAGSINDSGSFRVQSGTLSSPGVGSVGSTGTMDSTGSTLTFGTGANRLGSSGLILLNTSKVIGDINSGGSLSVTSSTFTGNITSTGALMVASLLNTGTLNHSGTLQLAATGSLTQSGGAVSAGALANAGGFRVQSAVLTALGASSNASTGTLDVTGSTLTFGLGLNRLANAGSFLINTSNVSGDINSSATLSATNSTFNGNIANTGVATIANLANTANFIQSGTLNASGNFFNGGSATFSGSQSWATGSTLMNSGSATLLSNAGAAGTNKLAIHVAGGSVTLGSPQNLAALVLDPVGTSFAGTVDLKNNYFLLGGGNLISTLRGYLLAGYNGGAWNGAGLVSSLAGAGQGIGYMDAATYDAIHPDHHFQGQQLLGNELLAKFTWQGDADFDGVITMNDYAQLTAGFLFGGFSLPNNPASWANGDFNYDGKIDYQDFALIDNAFQQQSGTLASDEIAQHAALFGSAYSGYLGSLETSSVPEPGTVLLVVGTMPLLLGARRKIVRRN